MTDKIRKMMEDIKEMSRFYNINVIVPSSNLRRSINQSQEVIMLGIKEDESGNKNKTRIIKKREKVSNNTVSFDSLRFK